MINLDIDKLCEKILPIYDDVSEDTILDKINDEFNSSKYNTIRIISHDTTMLISDVSGHF